MRAILLVVAMLLMATCGRDPYAIYMADMPPIPTIQIPGPEDDLIFRYNEFVKVSHRWAHLMSKGINDRATANEMSVKFRKLERSNGWVGEK